MQTELLQQAKQLDINEQIELVEAIWNNISKREAVPALSKAQKIELDSRLNDYLANPTEVLSWQEVKKSALAKIQK